MRKSRYSKQKYNLTALFYHSFSSLRLKYYVTLPPPPPNQDYTFLLHNTKINTFLVRFFFRSRDDYWFIFEKWRLISFVYLHVGLRFFSLFERPRFREVWIFRFHSFFCFRLTIRTVLLRVSLCLSLFSLATKTCSIKRIIFIQLSGILVRSFFVNYFFLFELKEIMNWAMGNKFFFYWGLNWFGITILQVNQGGWGPESGILSIVFKRKKSKFTLLYN